MGSDDRERDLDLSYTGGMLMESVWSSGQDSRLTVDSSPSFATNLLGDLRQVTLSLFFFPALSVLSIWGRDCLSR